MVLPFALETFISKRPEFGWSAHNMFVIATVKSGGAIASTSIVVSTSQLLKSTTRTVYVPAVGIANVFSF